MIQIYHWIIHYDLESTYYKMSISKKMKAIHIKIEQNKAQYNLDRETAKISALSSGNVNKYKFLAAKDVLPEKRPARKSSYNEKIYVFTVR